MTTTTTTAHIVRDASDLQLAPGYWPLTLNVQGVTYHVERYEWIADEVVAVHYIAHDGRTLAVFND